MKRRVLVLALATAGLVAPPLAAQGVRQQLEAAQAELRQTMIERGRDRLQRLLEDDPEADRAVLGDAHLLLGIAHLALRNADSAGVHFRRAVAANPFRTIDTDAHNPDVVAAYGRARREAPAIGLRLPVDTTLDPRTDSLPVQVGLGAPGRVTLRFGATGEDERALAPVEATHAFSARLPLTSADHPLAPGTYRVTGLYVSAAGDSVRTTAVIEMSRAPVDTAPHQAPLDTALFRPETRPGGMAIKSAITGTVIGATAAALPMLLWNGQLGSSEMRPGAMAVGAAVTIGGVVGMLTGRRQVPIRENISYNQGLRQQWVERNQAIAAENERARGFAPLRIRLTEQP